MSLDDPAVTRAEVQVVPGGTDRMDWQAFYFHPSLDWPRRLQQRAGQRFGTDGSLAEEAYTYALDRMSANGWERLRKYTGKAQPGTFLMAVFANLLQDFDRERHGRVRPPAAIEHRGPLWVRVFELLCLERKLPETVVEHLSARGDRKPEAVRSAIKDVKALHPRCGEEGRGEIPVDGEDLERAAEAAPSVSHLLEREARESWLLALSGLFGEPAGPGGHNDSPGRGADGTDTVALIGLMQPEDLLLLRLVYQEGFTAAAAARRLARPEHDVRRQLKRLLLRLREYLSARGVSADELIAEDR